MSLVAIWERRYIRPADLNRETSADTRRIVMTDARMTSLVNDAYNAGASDARKKVPAAVREALEELVKDGVDLSTLDPGPLIVLLCSKLPAK